MVYKKTVIPDKKNHSIEMPEEFFGKKVEVIMIEVDDKTGRAIPPPGKKIAVEKLFESFGAAPDFPSIEEIRQKAWPSKW